MRLTTESPGWNGLETLKSQLKGRLAKSVLYQYSDSRPRKLENEAAFFEDDLLSILTTKSIVVELSEERYDYMDGIAQDLLGVLDEMVNEVLIGQLQESQDPFGVDSIDPEDPKLWDLGICGGKYPRLRAMFGMLQSRVRDNFSLAAGLEPLLFILPADGYGTIARGHTKKWKAFLDQLAAEATISQGLQHVSLQAMGLSAEELSENHAGSLRRRARPIVANMFKHFRQLNCAKARMHEIRLGLSKLYSGLGEPDLEEFSLDVLMSCSLEQSHDAWHEAQCHSSLALPSNTESRSLCLVVYQAMEQRKKLHLLVNQHGLYDITDSRERTVASSANIRQVSLLTLFEERIFSQITFQDITSRSAAKKASMQEKSRIALNLARCLSEFLEDNIDLASHSWTPEQIFFIGRAHDSPALLSDVYVSFRPRDGELSPSYPLEEFGPGNPILLSFARLLIEIQDGEKIELDIHSSAKDNTKTWANLCQLVQMRKENGECAQYMEAVEGCLHLCNDLPKAKYHVTGRNASEVLRMAIYGKVIRKLEFIVNPSISKRKRQASVSDSSRAKRLSTMQPSVPRSLFGDDTAHIASHPKHSAPSPEICPTDVQRMYIEELEDANRQDVQGKYLAGSTLSGLGKSDGRLCSKNSSTRTRVEQPRTFQHLNETWISRIEFKNGDKIVRIAILDTGVDLHHEDFQNSRAIRIDDGQPISAKGEPPQIHRMPVEDQKNFCGADQSNVQDLDGHGTQVASIILRLAPRAELCIARICDGDIHRDPLGISKQTIGQPNHIRNPRPDNVVEAVRWAIERKVDILNMSFGFDECNLQVDEALRNAREAGILVFAAMANDGMHRKAAWPGRESEDAIGIHSCTEMGKSSSTFTPKYRKKHSEFMVIGENIPAHWPAAKGGGFLPVEGTSFATPVAVSMAAMVLAFANQSRSYRVRERSNEIIRVAELQSNPGMRRVMEAMSEPTDGYLWINPMLLWANFPDDGGEETPVAIREHGWKFIRTALKK